MSRIESVVFSAVFGAALVGSSSLVLADGSITGSVEAKPSKFLSDTIVYVKDVPGTKLAAKTVEIDQQGMVFKPHLVLIGVGDSVKFQNHDNVDHNVMSPDGGYDLGTWGNGASKDHTFKAAGVFGQTCKIHPEMIAYVFVGQNRFASAVDDKGNFTIAGLPPGTYELDVWNPKLKAAPQKITVGSGATTVHFAIAR